MQADASDLASRLLARFGSLTAIVDAKASELRACERETERWADWLIAGRSLVAASYDEKVIRTKLHPQSKALRGHLHFSMRSLREERMVAVFADRNGDIMAIETVSHGTADQLLLDPRTIFARALQLDCRHLLLAHNHPSGNCEPSSADIAQTGALTLQAKSLGIVVEDHLIIGRTNIVSMRDRGLL